MQTIQNCCSTWRNTKSCFLPSSNEITEGELVYITSLKSLTNNILNGCIVLVAVRNKEAAVKVDHDDAPVGGLRKRPFVAKYKQTRF